jgi:hypothetical protein
MNRFDRFHQHHRGGWSRKPERDWTMIPLGIACAILTAALVLVLVATVR